MLLPIAENCNKLERIDLIGCYPFDVGTYDELFEMLSSSLKSLKITGGILLPSWEGPDHNNLKRSDRFLKNLALCKDLEELEVPGVDLGKLGLKVIAEMNPLKKLQIRKLSEPLRRLPKGTIIDVEAIRNVDDFFINLKLECLTDLEILCSKSTTNSIFKILINREGCPKLQRICFIRCPNLKINYLELRQFVKSCPNLEYFYIDASSVSEISSQLLQEIDQKITLKVSGEDDDGWLSIDEHIKQRLKGNDLS